MAFNTAGAASGAAVGTAIMPGWGTAIGAVLGGFAGGGGAPAGVSGSGGTETRPQAGAAQAAAMGSGLDGSAWIVNFGSNNSNTLDNRQDKTVRSAGPEATATANPRVGADPYNAYTGYLDEGMGGGGLFASVPPLVWLFVGGAVLYRLNKKKG